MTYCIISKCQEREDQFERINFLFLNLLEKSLIPTNINIVFVVISHNSLVPLKWEAPKSENRSIINYAIFKMAMKMLIGVHFSFPQRASNFTKNHISFWSASKHSSLVITFLKSSDRHVQMLSTFHDVHWVLLPLKQKRSKYIPCSSTGQQWIL